MKITITWSAIFEDADEPTVTRCSTDFMTVLARPPQNLTATALKWWLEADAEDAEPWSDFTNWDMHVESDDEISAIVVIHEPPEMSGVFSVRAERKVTVQGYEPDAHDVARALRIMQHAEGAQEGGPCTTSS